MRVSGDSGQTMRQGVWERHKKKFQQRRHSAGEAAGALGQPDSLDARTQCARAWVQGQCMWRPGTENTGWRGTLIARLSGSGSVYVSSRIKSEALMVEVVDVSVVVSGGDPVVLVEFPPTAVAMLSKVNTNSQTLTVVTSRIAAASAPRGQLQATHSRLRVVSCVSRVRALVTYPNRQNPELINLEGCPNRKLHEDAHTFSPCAAEHRQKTPVVNTVEFNGLSFCVLTPNSCVADCGVGSSKEMTTRTVM